MSENLKVWAFAFGAVLLLIALLGGNFKLFGAEVSATISNKFLRFTSFALGTTLMAVAMHSPNSGYGLFVPTQSLPLPTPSRSRSLKPGSSAAVRSPVPIIEPSVVRQPQAEPLSSSPPFGTASKSWCMGMRGQWKNGVDGFGNDDKSIGESMRENGCDYWGITVP